MKTNNFKILLVFIFIAVLILLSMSKQNATTTSGATFEQVMNPPTKVDNDYISFYNSIDIYPQDILCAYYSKYYNIVYSTETETYVSGFDSSGYKKYDIKLLPEKAYCGEYTETNLIISTGSKVFYFDNNFILSYIKNIEDCYSIKTFDNLTYFFCKGNISTTFQNNEYYISSPYTFIQKQGNYFIFKNNTTVMLTDLDQELYFENCTFQKASIIDDCLFFACIINDCTIITCIKQFEIAFSTIITQTAKYINFQQEDNGLNIFMSEEKTYKYFICNHGDVISSSLYGNYTIIDLSTNTILNNNTVSFIYNNKTHILPTDLYFSTIKTINNYIFCYQSSFFKDPKSIYFAKIKTPA